jgi:hypothetical protein
MMAHCILEFLLPYGCHVTPFYKLLFGFSFRMFKLHVIQYDSLRYEATHLMYLCTSSVANSFIASCACQYLWHPMSTDCGIVKP